MARTRAQTAKAAGDETETKATKPITKNTPQSKSSKPSQTTSSKKRKSGPRLPADNPPKDKETIADEQPSTKRARASKSPGVKAKKPSKPPKISNPKVERLIEKYGQLPLSDIGLSSPADFSSETVLAHIFNAILSSARISHAIAAETLRYLIKADYHDLNSLKKSTWEERTEVLTKGGYTHYREKTATALGELAELLNDEYGGEPTDMVKAPDKAARPKEVQKDLGARLKEIKGMGPLGVDIFFGTAQAIVPGITPFISSRDMKVAKEIGLESDSDKLFHEVGDDAMNMARLSAALTRIRLDKHVSEFA